MKLKNINIVMIVFVLSSCGAIKERYELNKGTLEGQLSPNTLLSKSKELSEKHYYDLAAIAALRALNSYEKEQNYIGQRNAYILLCNIYKAEGSSKFNNVYDLDHASFYCKKAGIKTI